MSSGLVHRGINYDVGTRFGTTLTRPTWRAEEVAHELDTIRDDLHCTSVNVYGTDLDRLVDAAQAALDRGLHVWLQPRLIDAGRDDVLAHLADAARAAERLRTEHTNVVLNVGCELTIFSAGIMPGDDYAQRTAKLSKPYWWPAFPVFNRRLDSLLERACAVAREQFRGELTYGAALWERVDWRRFDYVGLNYYRLKYNRARYAASLRKFHRHGKPIVITEFGCGAFDGAAELGPSSHSIVEYGDFGGVLKGEYTRNEQVQADYIADLLGIYRDEGIHGAFVFEFVEPHKPHSSDPRDDLDMAGYGVVKVIPGEGGRLRWEPKAAFRQVARIYGD